MDVWVPCWNWWRCEMLTKKRSAVPGCTVSRLGSGCGDWRESVLFCCPKKLQWSIFRGFLSNTWSSNQGSLPHPIDPHRSARTRWCVCAHAHVCVYWGGLALGLGSVARERALWQTDEKKLLIFGRTKKMWQSSSLGAFELGGVSDRSLITQFLGHIKCVRVHEIEFGDVP